MRNESFHADDLAKAFVTKDKDFAGLSMVRGAPPKVVLVQTGNSSTARIENVLRSNAIRLSEFGRDPKRSLVILEPRS